MSQKTRLDKNSATRAVAGFQGSIDEIEPPAGIDLSSDEEVVIWGQFTRARAREDWRDMDLILLAKIVKLEAGIRRHQETLDRSGILIKNKRETLIVNPLVSVIDTLERRQLAIIRSMSLNQTAMTRARLMRQQGRAMRPARLLGKIRSTTFWRVQLTR